MNFVDIFQNLWKSTGIFNMILPADPNLSGAEQIMHMYGAPIMFLVCLVLRRAYYVPCLPCTFVLRY